MPVRFRREQLQARFAIPDGAGTSVRSVEIRFDPLLGTTSRIAEGVKLQTADEAALVCFQQPDPNCPFCPERIAQVTPCIDPSVSREQRIRVGESVLFPNLVPYSRFAAVAVFTPKHWLSVAEFSPTLISDNLRACIRYIREAYRFDPESRHCAWNINYLYPSGGSLPHPHSQVFLDPFPTTMMRFQFEAGQRYWAENRSCFWEDLVVAERESQQRFLWELGSTAWMTAFSPNGFNEVRAVVRGRETLLEIDDADIVSISTGVSRVLQWYGATGYNSFNLTLFSGPLDGASSFRVNLVMVTRAAMAPYYRNDSMHMERLHWEAAVDRAPEAIAAELRRYTSNAS